VYRVSADTTGIGFVSVSVIISPIPAPIPTDRERAGPGTDTELHSKRTPPAVRRAANKAPSLRWLQPDWTSYTIASIHTAESSDERRLPVVLSP